MAAKIKDDNTYIRVYKHKTYYFFIKQYGKAALSKYFLKLVKKFIKNY